MTAVLRRKLLREQQPQIEHHSDFDGAPSTSAALLHVSGDQRRLQALALTPNLL
jgi:hypothetical protein